jgi:outer membrane biosynthesis protein TonB
MVSTDFNQRVNQLASNSVARAFALSLAAHFICFAVLELGFELGLWRHTLGLAKLLKRSPQTEARLRNEPKRGEQPVQEVPLEFVEVDPAQSTEKPPEKAKYYSARNSIAANPDPQIESNLPKITGTQDKVPKTADLARAEPKPPPPAPPVEEQKATPQPLQPAPQPTPQIAPEPGELTQAKPAEPTETKTMIFSEAIKPSPSPATPPAPPRPRRLADARKQIGLAGEKMKQEGGVKRRASIEGLDVKATPFGSYDAKIIAAIQQHWYELLDERNVVRSDSGKVVLTFRLHSNGRVTEMRVMENGVSDILALLCQQAITGPAPYEPWPDDMRRLVGAEYREVRFTFHYN